MPVQVSYPGVYVQEIPSGVRTITGVSTSIALFIGRTERGIQDRPTRLFNFSDYVRSFGEGAQESETAHQVRRRRFNQLPDPLVVFDGQRWLVIDQLDWKLLNQAAEFMFDDFASFGILFERANHSRQAFQWTIKVR